MLTTMFSMRAIQITIDEELLAALDADPEVRRDGRSAVIRRATYDYLRRSQRRAIAEQYEHAYGEGRGLESGFEGWEDEGRWPEE